MRKYSSVSGSSASGVPSARASRNLALQTPMSDIRRPIASISTMAVAAYCRSSCSREAPKYCEISTPAPMEKPMASAVNKTVSDAQAPTADSACWPLKLPTMMVSAVLYSCCSRFPAMIGKANCTMSFQGVPRVRSLVMMRSSPE